jgi:hypothetical protein
MLELTVGAEDGFVDLCLEMNGFAREQNGKVRFEAKAIHKSQKVGFAVTLGPDWEVQKLEDTDQPPHLYWGEAQLSSLGEESDLFVQVLDRLYETRVGAARMSQNVDVTAVSLGGHPRSLETEPLKMKFFFDVDPDERYAEFYLNCDVVQKRVEFHEKDQDYRKAVVLALSAPYL